MSMPKPDEASKEWFRSLVPDAPGVEVRPMFGNLAAFVNKNMVLALFEYVVLPASWRKQRSKAKAWVDRSLAHAGALPPKRK